jgi:hypothetical protein
MHNSQVKLVVVLDGASVLEYDRSKPLTDRQQASLEQMDRKMGAGITLDGIAVRDPDPHQRARFVAGQMFAALQADNEPLTAAALAYLANRIPDLKQVRADAREDGLAIDLVLDKPYVPEAKLEFVKPAKH